ncbi:glucose-6-phosphate dehydrogenase [Alicyclobacillus cycloheptanicus]|uniref:Glucose-6-phosphate 1-dehydrogenase n=1 Tax=Alicyclobacillus cycloheptanicus TaxID=1457 RepID=A0ABT9XDJ3_9BACL|nr:glucose-6-phosphate dehydrogenase [Alicyclobacillus cycloheptanicus]MDQ0188210.1 glucose-6-phosphate 1-dehydrogenase [Alicyclobacillus cycloheptanicus]WDM00940.1 glucose-6-phosphate dehydrogenase [Alicyclobacillus cycloheptanicus]
MDDQTFILFGASGDLAKRKVLPALYNLHRDGKMPRRFTVIGASRRPYSREAFQGLVMDALHQYSRHPVDSDETTAEFLDRFHYVPFDAGNADDYTALKGYLEDLEARAHLPQNRLFYLAMAPDFFGTIAVQLQASGLTSGTGWKRLVIEKPFGHDYRSAAELNRQVSAAFDEREVFRIDHYLGKEMVQNIEIIRFANSIFEPLWNNRFISNVQITSSEVVGVEDRAAYYEKAGALRDMVQNHMMQMLMLIAMEPPSRLNTEAIRDEKVKVLRSLRRYDEAKIAQNVVRGQYLSGRVGGQEVVGYLNEPGVAPTSTTETFVAAKLYVDNFRWAGVPFYIRTGKRMKEKMTKIVVQFESIPDKLFFNKDSSLAPNLLTIHVNPVQGMELSINVEQEESGRVEPSEIDFTRESRNSPEAYERLIEDAMTDDPTFFTRWDEVSLAWKWVDPISEAFQQHQPLYPYIAGSTGPAAADELIRADGFRWWNG